MTGNENILSLMGWVGLIERGFIPLYFGTPERQSENLQGVVEKVLPGPST